ncbi:MAG: Bax inhibitor-1/YccA family protein [Gammaproteobacteria bacterium]|nr:Bax inhibitor-1/YccA family protein [Gammaproteobacteria bacterium]
MQFENPEYAVLNKKVSLLSVNQVLRKTYFLLSLTLIFSAFVASITMHGILPYAGPAFTLIGMFGLMFLAQSLRNSKWALLAVFAFTGFMGYALAPLMATYLQTYYNGGKLIITALGGTGAIFISLSLYTLISRKDFSYMGGFLFAAISAAFLASVASIFLHLPLLSVMVSCAFVLVSSGLILFQTSQIINGGERNYIMATISLYVSLFNLFISLLNILSFFSGNRRA